MSFWSPGAIDQPASVMAFSPRCPEEANVFTLADEVDKTF
jgi:hypothetical protein